MNGAPGDPGAGAERERRRVKGGREGGRCGGAGRGGWLEADLRGPTRAGDSLKHDIQLQHAASRDGRDLSTLQSHRFIGRRDLRRRRGSQISPDDLPLLPSHALLLLASSCVRLWSHEADDRRRVSLNFERRGSRRGFRSPGAALRPHGPAASHRPALAPRRTHRPPHHQHHLSSSPIRPLCTCRPRTTMTCRPRGRSSGPPSASSASRSSRRSRSSSRPGPTSCVPPCSSPTAVSPPHLDARRLPAAAGPDPLPEC